MRPSVLRRAGTAALALAAALAPTVAAAHPGGAHPGSSHGVDAQRVGAQRALHARLLGEKTVPHKLDFQDTTVGGLSGIDRNPCTGSYALISDDRSFLQPVRFYTARIDVDADGVHSVDFTSTHPLLRPDGSVYPSPITDPAHAADPEEMRVDPRGGCHRLWWAQEGDRPTKEGDPVVQPALQRADLTGAYRGTFRLPPDYAITPGGGPRRNESLEAFTFGSRGHTLTSAIEGPLVQDGPEPTLAHGALVRVTRQNRGGRVLGQFAYPLEKIFTASDPSSPWPPSTGVPSILAFPGDPDRYLVLERTWVAGAGYKIRLYDATTRGATDVRAMDSLAGEHVVPMRKKLVADFDTLGLSRIENTEGMTWGPALPSGERTVVLVSDDNFSADESTQVVALAVR
ncbi:esterase-like activity of phytase family protein [Streptomyces beihaiensis]|uniref:Esterase-like activity of phytase family protein n=1 Tax=Streptomyces beihaiensis TaxID=2984495 RepID=A0ABT3TNP4_9ACTN|nr:esterase-like activity of phytase family protein [Streptomyces beihaiensis]MCX3058670.1 esterase-like activity of phytase family protein [Streptomyces beihaiensis]